MGKALLLLFILTTIGSGWCQNVNIQLAARNLASGDLIWGPPDPFVRVKYAIGPNPFNLVGKTATLHTKDPDWSEVFEFIYVEHLDQKIQFEIVEADAIINDPYGTVTLTVREIFSSTTLERDFGKGRLIIKNV